MFDIVQWALGMDNSGPVKYEAPIEPTASRGLKMYYDNGIELEHKNFGRGFAISDVEVGHRTATLCHIANLAYEYRRPLNWDPVKEEFIDDFEANLRRSKHYRKPYELIL
jgi:hypothetical protein